MADDTEQENLNQLPTLPEDASEEKKAIFKAVMDFNDSDALEISLPQFTRQKARVYIHSVADQLGMYHRSDGKGKERHVTLAKTAPLVPCGKFDQESGTWKEYAFNDSDVEPLKDIYDEGDQLRCLTFNVLCHPESVKDDSNSELRMAPTFAFLESRNAHIITLNEVGKQFYVGLLSQKWVQERYWVAALGDATLTPGNLILSRLPIRKCIAHELKFSHKIVNIVELVLPGTKHSVWLGTGHLKAGPAALFHRYRHGQVLEMTRQLGLQSPTPNYLIMGDLNIRDSEKEEIPELDVYTDLWTTLHPNEVGFTYDPFHNSLAEMESNRICSLDSTRVKVANRYDRILLRSPRFTPVSCDILAKDAVVHFPDGTVHTLSDHYALEAVIKLRKE